MFRSTLLLLAFPIAGAAAQESGLRLDITATNNGAVRIERTSADSTAPVQIGSGHLIVQYFAPMRPKDFTVVAEDSSDVVSV